MTSKLITLGKRLREARLQAGLSQSDVARRIGKSKQLASAWEAGRAEMTSTTLGEFARIVSADTNWLLLGMQSGNCRSDTPRLPAGMPVPLLTASEAIKFARGKLQLSEVETSVYSCFPFSGDMFALAPPDMGMDGDLTPCDLVVVEHSRDVQPGAMAAVVVRQTETRLDRPLLVVRRVHYRSADLGAAPFDLVPSATGWPTLKVRTPAHAIILGPVSAVFRHIRT